jgi:predicted tellurium resistance membrane protein TerC
LKSKAQSVTNLQLSPEEERRSRMIRYSIAMSLRFVCIVLAMVLQGWMMWLCFAGAILLPYFAVVIANSRGSSKPAVSAKTHVAKPLSIEAAEFVAAANQQKPEQRAE